MADALDLAQFHYDLPEALIAQAPPRARRDARLLVWRADGALEDSTVAALAELLRQNDALVLNDTRVLPARLLGRRLPGQGAGEVLLLRPEAGGDGSCWLSLVRPGRRLRPGARIELEGGVIAEILAIGQEGVRLVRFPAGLDVAEHARRHGHMPLPPYIRRADQALDRDRYQTVYARAEGSAAAPTAGLHLDPELLATIRARGVTVCAVTLHIGLATFRPLSEGDLHRNALHSEAYSVSAATLATLRERRAQGGRVVAVGTTACRALETVDPSADADQQGETTLFLRPGSRFRAVDVLLTNFHLPHSSLLLLVAAFAGPRWRAAYAHAVASGYRFFSYGDANWIERAEGAV